MTSRCHLGRFGLVCVGLFLAAAPAAAQESERSATLIVRLPADARLLVDDKETKQTGPERRFHSPPLEPGKRYHYVFRWTYRKDGKLVTRKTTVNVRAGETRRVDLNDEDAGEEVTDEKEPEKGRKKEPTKSDDKEPARTTKTDVVYVPTPQDVVDRMLELAAVKKDDVVYDLGCGDGRIVVTAARKYHCKAVGVEIDAKRVKEARDNVKTNDVGTLVTIEEKDLFKVDLQPASVVTMYLLPELNVRLLPQLEKMKDGSRIVSHDFAIKGYKPTKTATVESKDDNRTHTLYLWVTPLKKE